MQASRTQTLEYLDLLPANLYGPVVTHQHGHLQQRCSGVLCWYRSLIQGGLPEYSAAVWPEGERFSSLIAMLLSSGIVPYCKNQPQRTEQIILDILKWLDGEAVDFSSDDERKDECKEELSAETESNNRSVKYSKSSSSKHDKEGGDQSTKQDPYLNEVSWNKQAEALKELDPLMRDFAIERRLGWDLSTGLLTRSEWKDVLDIHKNLKQSVYLKNIISLVGRSTSQDSESGNDLSESLQKQSVIKRQQSILSEHAPFEASGIARSDDVGRMLPSELSALGHRKLRMLWHAKRAERMLLSYQYEGVLSEHLPVLDSRSLSIKKNGKEKLTIQGPMIICLDTSASMKGKCEQLAKAICLETMRVAKTMKRSCILLSFSGPDEIQEYELSHSEQGWTNILNIISESFHGGTDVSSVINRCLALIEAEEWRDADVLLVSDSRFNVPDELLEFTKHSQTKYGFRVHGINVSRWKSAAMKKICHPLYRVTSF